MDYFEPSALKSYKFSLLRNATSSNIETQPFPHIVINNALPHSLAQSLTASFPLSEFKLGQNNKRFDISVSQLDNLNSISDEWRRFIYFHSSKYFFSQILQLFKDHLPQKNELSNIVNNKKISVGRRKVDSFESSDILMDAQISINSPVIKKSSVRKIHVDHPNKIFSGLFYLRMPKDESGGGDLQLCSWKSNYSLKQKLKFYKEGVAEKHINVDKVIKYQSNVCVLFLNSIDALHGVTPRHVTDQTRTFVNLVGEVPFDLYKKDSNFTKWVTKFRQKLSYFKKLLFKVNS
jgi:hypothetical protein